ncbi:MAG: hypothetical protein IKS41_07280, partial [Alphaproteobacteria bacterium]|nr:hypothetical protein [Alphaproteobacteria bacterium]
IHNNRGQKDFVEDRTRELLHSTYLDSAATRDTAAQMSVTMAESIQGGGQDRRLSNALYELSEQVSEVQAQKKTKRGDR